MNNDHKTPTFQISEMTNKHPDFYRLVGPLLSRRDIVAELGSPVWDDDGKTWLIAHNDTGVLGLVGLHKQTVCSLYVVPGSRGERIGIALLLNLLNASERNLRAVATESSLPLFEGCGFRVNGTRGRYHLMEYAV